MGRPNPRWAAPTRKMFLELSVLRASGTVACPRRPCERESSFSVQSAEPVAQTTAGSQRSWDSLAGLGPEERRVRAPARMSSRRTSGPNTSGCGGSRRSDNRRERKAGGQLGGWLRSRAPESLAQQVRPQGNPRWTSWSTLRRSGPSRHGFNHELDRILKSQDLLILQSR